MTMTEVLYDVSQILLALSCVLVLARLWRGPSVFDRVLATDTIALAVVGYLLLAAEGPVGRYFTDAALGLALFAFIGTTLIAHLLRRGELPDD